jgi:FkbM family methyltransferase
MVLLPIAPLMSAYRTARRSGFLNTGFGRKLFLSSYFAYKRYLEDPHAALIGKRPELFHGGDIIDVGANIGYCSVLFAKAASAGANVYAFEPEPFNFELLQQAIRAHRVDGIVVPSCTAVGASDGSLKLWLNENHHADHRIVTGTFAEAADTQDVSIDVPVIAIDSLFDAKTVKFIKVDVQGYELAVCRGMEKTLAGNPDCALSLEYMPDALLDLGFSPSELPAWFKDRGFRCYVLSDAGDLKEGAPGELGAGGWTNLIFSRTAL